MINFKNQKKLVSIIVIVAFVFQFDFFSYSQAGGDIEMQFLKAKKEYNEGKYENIKIRLERIIADINDNRIESERKDMMGKCHLLLGAVYEKENKPTNAEENYLKAKNNYGIDSIEGVFFDDLPIYKQVVKGEIDIDRLFENAMEDYKSDQNKNSTEKIEQIIDFIKNKNLDRKDMLGKCHLLLGAIYEKVGNLNIAGDNYQRAKEMGIFEIDGVNLTELSKYREIIKGEKPPNIIDKPSRGKSPKKKFPWLIVAGGVVIVAIVAIILLKKKPIYTLTVTIDEGVAGTPTDGTYSYKKGKKIDYSYSLKPGYSSMTVLLDRNALSASGTISINMDHTLAVASSANQVNFITDKETVEVPEGATATFNVSLSAQPKSDVNVTIARDSGYTGITVLSGANLTFTTTTWNSPQQITLQADIDSNAENEQATIRINEDGIPQKLISATEQDNIAVSITSPKDGDVVNVIVPIKADITGTSGISKVEFYVDNYKIGSVSQTPYKINWDTKNFFEGPHVIKAIAYNTDEKPVESPSITVTFRKQ